MNDFDKDTWSTPPWLFSYLDSIYNFDIDLCASDKNNKCEQYYTIEDDALKCWWYMRGSTGFCNPPYSKIAPWITKAIDQARYLFTTVMLIPTPNGESYYEDAFNHAASITYINGRIAFIAPERFIQYKKDGSIKRIYESGEEVSGNSRGSCIVEFSYKYRDSSPQLYHVDRDELKRIWSEQ